LDLWEAQRYVHKYCYVSMRYVLIVPYFNALYTGFAVLQKEIH